MSRAKEKALQLLRDNMLPFICETESYMIETKAIALKQLKDEHNDTSNLFESTFYFQVKKEIEDLSFDEFRSKLLPNYLHN